MGRKTVVIDHKNKLDSVSKHALQLLKTMQSLSSHDKNCLMYSLRGQHDIGISNSDQIDHFLGSLAKAAHIVKEVNLEPISDGYYNPFIFMFVDNLLESAHVKKNFIEQFILKKKKPTKDRVEKFLTEIWKTNYSKRARETAIHIIQKKLSVSKDRQAAQKTVDRHLDCIVAERTDFHAKKLVEFHDQSA
jgi:hypothetical protein